MKNFEEDYEDIKFNHNAIFMKYHDNIIRLINRQAYKYNLDADDLICESYIWFISCCNVYDPWYNGHFIAFDKYLFTMLYKKITAYAQKKYKTGGYSSRKKYAQIDYNLDWIADKSNNSDDIYKRIDIDHFLSLLTDNYRKSLLLSLAGYSQKDIGEYLGLSQYRISSILQNLRNAALHGVTKRSTLYHASEFIRNYRPIITR